MEIKLFDNFRTQSNTYLIIRDNICYMVDPGGTNMSDIINYLKENQNLIFEGILLTHGHYDHIIGIPEVLEYKKVPVYISEKDYNFLYDSSLSLATWIGRDFKLSDDVEVHKFKEGDEIFGFNIIETPGHTHGGVCFYDEKNSTLVSGDTIFKGTYGRVDLPTGSMNDMNNSIAKLMKLDGETIVYPGHGEHTYIKDEKSRYMFY